MDDQIAALFERLDALPGFERAVVMIVGDHGEGLCQHGQSAHGATWDEQVHAPMMLRVPGEPPRRVPWVCSVVDALPTLLGRPGARGFEAFLQQSTGRDVLARGFEPRPAMSQDTRQRSARAGYRYSLTTDR
jgi:arylsulfatase A-like enzyme